MRLARPEHHGQRFAAALGAEMHLRRVAAPAPTERLLFGPPFPPRRRVLVRPDRAAVHEPAIPVQPPLGVGLPLGGGEDPIPDAREPPAPQAARQGGPGAVPRRHIAPGCPRPHFPQDAVDDPAAATARAAPIARWSSLRDLPYIIGP